MVATVNKNHSGVPDGIRRRTLDVPAVAADENLFRASLTLACYDDVLHAAFRNEPVAEAPVAA